MSTYKTDAIVIRSQDFAESDILLTLFTQSHGKIKGILKSGRKSSSKLVGPCQFLNQIQISVYGKQQVELHKITQVDMVKSYEMIRDNLDKLSWASLYVEFLQRSTGDHQHDQELFDLTTFYLDELTHNPEHTSITVFFLWKLLQIAGFSPLLSQCVKCGKPRPVLKSKNEHTYQFDSRKGGILCSQCGEKSIVKSTLFSVTSDQIDLIEHSLRESPSDLSSISGRINKFQNLLELLLAHARYQLEGDFKTMKFLKYLSSAKLSD